MDDPVGDASVEAALTASRALLGVVARSLTDVLQDLSLPQFRVLVILSGSGRLRIGALAERLDANPSTFSRAVDRMVARGWVRRVPSTDSRREVLVAITDAGLAVVDEVTRRRRRDIAAILERMSPADRVALTAALGTFADAAGEPRPSDLLELGL